MFQKKGVGTRRLKYGFAARDGSAVKPHSTILQRLRRQISPDYYTIPPATQATLIFEENSAGNLIALVISCDMVSGS